MRNVYKSYRKLVAFGQRDVTNSFIILLFMFPAGEWVGGIGEEAARNRAWY